MIQSMMKKALPPAVLMLGIGGLSLPALSFEPENAECIAPANAGGGWDFTCRQVGKVLYDLELVPNPVQVINTVINALGVPGQLGEVSGTINGLVG